MTSLILAYETVLDQLEMVLIKIAPNDYARLSSGLNGSSIGQHIRHVLEFFVCLNQGVEIGMVNYDRRSRDPRIETDPAFALTLIHQLRMQVQTGQDRPIQLQVEYQDCVEQLLQTTFAREIAYTIEHAIHHMAMIKIGIREVTSDLELPVEFGVAPSTLRHQRQSVLQII